MNAGGKTCLTVALAAALLSAFATRAPVSEEFAQWLDDGAPRGGFIPHPADMSHLPAAYKAFAAKRASEGRQLMRSAALPSRWDSREHNWVTPVRDQDVYGTCWAHATLACLETARLRATSGAETNSFSPNHLAAHDVGFAATFNSGGNGDMATALLASWRDPLNEQDDPYPNPASKVDLPSVRHVQNTIQLPARADETDNDTLKQAVMDYGAVSVAYNGSKGSTNARTGAYYCETYYTANHEVTLVGWDDNYSTNNFSLKPPSNGAFLIKNSWGLSSGTTNGYVWISYCDATFVRSSGTAFVYPEAESAQNYGRIYQYDPCGSVEKYNVLESGESMYLPYTNWCANVFTSVATGIVEAAGFYSLSPGTEYTLRVYNALAGSTPETGTLVSEQTGTVSVAGFVTVKLATPVPIVDSGERFAVAVALTSPDTDYPIAVEQTEAGYVSCTANAGESFYSKDGRTWKDFQRFDKTANVCIKAYTRFGADGPLTDEPLIASVSPSETHLCMYAGDTAAFAVETVEEATDASIAWTVDGVVVGSEAEFTYAPTAVDHNVHAVVCQVRRDGRIDSRTWSVSVATDINVSDDATLAAAIGNAVEGDRILVAPGTYHGRLDGPAVPALILGVEGPEETFLVRTNSTCCYYGGYNEHAILAGFTLKDGQCNYGGGALYGVISNCVITSCLANYGGAAYGCELIDCILDGNVAYGYGGGAYGCTLKNCVVRNNTVYNYDGGGAYDCTLTDCVVSNCIAYCGGGAAYSYVINSLVVGNNANGLSYWSPWDQSGLGGGAYECILTNVTIASNWAKYYGGGAYLHEVGNAFNSIVATNVCASGYGNGNDVYGSAYWTMVNTISDQDAKFVDAEHGDWHLSATSPAIDAGSNAFVSVTHDLDGAERIFGSRVDLGCYEYNHVPEGWPQPEVSPGATPEQEAACVATALTNAGFSAETAAHVTTVSDYNRLTAWSEAKGVPAKDLGASSTALLSPALGAAGIVAIEPEDINTVAISISTSDGGAMEAKMKLSLEAYDAARCDPSLLKAAVGVVGASTPSAPKFTSENLSVSVAPVSDGIEVTVTPPDGESAYFLKPTVR